MASAASAPAPRRRRAQARVPVGLLLGLGWVLVFGALGWLASLTILGYQGLGTAAALGAFVLLPAFGLWWVARAGAEGGVFLLVMALTVVLLSDLSLRGASSGLDAQSAVKFALWLSGLMLLPWRWSVLRLAAKDMPTFALLLFGLWALASTVYSISPLYTFAAALGFLGLWVTAVTLATTIDPPRAQFWLTCMLFAMSAASLTMYGVARDVAMVAYENSTTLRLGGIFGNANAVGGVSALALLLVATAWFAPVSRRTVWLSCAALPVCLASLALSQSRTAMLGLTAALVVVFVRRRLLLLAPGLLLGVAAAVLVLGYPGFIDTLIALVARSGRIEQVTTFTGRTEIWAFVVSAIEQAPVLGYGFASAKTLIPAGYAGPFGWTTSSAHNLWLQVWVTTGGIGLLLILASQFGLLRALVLRPLPLRDGVFVYVLFVGLLEPGPMGPSVNLLTFIWIWATANSLRQPAGKG
jgi:O-antigen ligase